MPRVCGTPWNSTSDVGRDVSTRQGSVFDGLQGDAGSRTGWLGCGDGSPAVGVVRSLGCGDGSPAVGCAESESVDGAGGALGCGDGSPALSPLRWKVVAPVGVAGRSNDPPPAASTAPPRA
jgi:hypothetical protein